MMNPLPPQAISACRVTVVTPLARVDVALPVQSTLAELVPQLVRLAGADSQAPVENPGWVLSRLGAPPLPAGLTVSAAAIHDGEVLYLNPRDRQIGSLLFDDVVDAIASAAENRDGAWGPRIAYRVGVGATAALFVGATLLLLASQWGGVLAPVGIGALAAVLLLLGGAMARAYGDVVAGMTCALAGIPAAVLAGVTTLAPHTLSLGAGPIAVGLAALTVYGVLAIVVIADRLSWLLCLTVAAAFGAVGGAVVPLAGVRPVDAAAVCCALATALAAVAPSLALRLARLPLPRVPADMDAFRADEKPTLGPDVLGRTSAAEQVLAGLVAALGLVVFGGVIVLLRNDVLWQAILAGVLGVVWLLRSRSYAGTAHRVVLVVTGLAVLALAGDWLVRHDDHLALLGGAAVLAVAGALCLWYANRVARGRRSPYWSRLLDIAEFISLLAVVPLVGAVVGIYAAIRGAIGG